MCNFSMGSTQRERFWTGAGQLSSYRQAVLCRPVAHCTTSAKVQRRLPVDARTTWRPGLWLHSHPPVCNLLPMTWAPAQPASCLTHVWWFDPWLVPRARCCLFHHRSLTETGHPIVGEVFPSGVNVVLRGALRLWDSGFYPKGLPRGEHLNQAVVKQPEP